MNHPAVVTVEGVGKRYPGGVTALSDASLTIARGELVAIVGPSGCGKSTLLHLMGALDSPTSGRVCVDGVDLGSLSDRQLSALRARRIGFVFQQFHLSPGMSLVDNVAQGRLYAGVPAARRLADAERVLRRVGLGHRLHHRPHEVSGGERQRAAVARAVVGDPVLVLADEPTGNLDQASGAAVLALLHELNAAYTTIVVVTHDRDVAGSLPRRVTMVDGRVVGDERLVEVRE